MLRENKSSGEMLNVSTRRSVQAPPLIGSVPGDKNKNDERATLEATYTLINEKQGEKKNNKSEKNE